MSNRLNFNSVPVYYKGLPNQVKAFAWLEQNCPDDIREGFTKIWRTPEPVPAPMIPKPVATKILDYVPQPDAVTCQAACIAKAIGTTDVMKVRRELLSMGQPGDPYVMGAYLKSRVKQYRFSDNGTLNDMCEYLSQSNRMVITHGWFTNSGHVISVVNTNSQGMVVDDPFGRFNFVNWCYTNDINGNDVIYPYSGMYAACIAGSSAWNAKTIYNAGALKMDQSGAWIHFIEN